MLGPYQWFTTSMHACLQCSSKFSRKGVLLHMYFLQHGKNVRYTVLLTRRLFLGKRNVWSGPVLPRHRFPLETKTHWVLHRTCRQPKGIYNTVIKKPTFLVVFIHWVVSCCYWKIIQFHVASRRNSLWTKSYLKEHPQSRPKPRTVNISVLFWPSETVNNGRS